MGSRSVVVSQEPRIGPANADPDSRARTHLANERTFLAWLRTGLSLVAVGLAAAHFLPEDLVPGFPVVTFASLTLVLLGTSMVLFGAARYVKAHREIETGSYASEVWPIVAVAIVIAVLAVLSLPLVILMR
jgi:putative membrane protein